MAGKHIGKIKACGLEKTGDFLYELAINHKILKQQLTDTQQRLTDINSLLDDGYQGDSYDMQAVNQAHRIASGGEAPKETKRS